MQIDRLTLQNFRNYREQAASFDPVCNVIFGDNAEGKTNLLEAIYYLSCGKSPRTRFDRELIRFETDEARLNGRIFSNQRDFLTEVSLFRGKRRKISINGVPAKSAAALSERFNTVFFSPDDLALIRDGAAARRRFLDMALCQLRPRYALALSEYNRALEQKTRILRDCEERPDLLKALPDFNEQLVRFGAVLIRYRAQYALRLQEYAAAYDASQIQVLEGLEAVRKRPGHVYRLHLLLRSAPSGVRDRGQLHRRGAGRLLHHIEVVIEPGDIITVTDDGRGIPVDIQEQTGKPALEVVYTVLHAGGKFGGGGYKVSGGLHGVGASVVNALSEWLEVRSTRTARFTK
jgi:hypothetical protein